MGYGVYQLLPKQQVMSLLSRDSAESSLSLKHTHTTQTTTFSFQILNAKFPKPTA